MQVFLYHPWALLHCLPVFVVGPKTISSSSNLWNQARIAVQFNETYHKTGYITNILDFSSRIVKQVVDSLRRVIKRAST